MDLLATLPGQVLVEIMKQSAAQAWKGTASSPRNVSVSLSLAQRYGRRRTEEDGGSQGDGGGGGFEANRIDEGRWLTCFRTDTSELARKRVRAHQRATEGRAYEQA